MQPLDLLAETDRELRSELGTLRSLCPSRETATPLVDIAEQLLTASTSRERGWAFAGALGDIVRAQAVSFPENVFWDFEYAAARLFDAACAVSDDELTAVRRLVVDLVRAFGRESSVQFRYVHDFSYGFDWARWVTREPPERSAVGPLDPMFLAHMRRRAFEIAGLIAHGDTKYPALERGVARNPFGFSREPADEARLLRDLAERDLIPVQAWRMDARPDWNRPYAAEREARAQALGLWKRT
jgi:hypothetical protein